MHGIFVIAVIYQFITMLQVILNKMVDKRILDIELEESPYQKGWVSARYKKNIKLN